MQDKDLMDRIIRCGLRVNNILGLGFTWDIYAAAMMIELRDNGIKADNRKVFPVKYKEKTVGEIAPHIVAENKAIIQIHCDSDITNESESRIKNYLRAADLRLGVIINFGENYEFKRYEL